MWEEGPPVVAGNSPQVHPLYDRIRLVSVLAKGT